MTSETPFMVTVPEKVLLAGFGSANQAVARALTIRGHSVTVFDDDPSQDVETAADEIGLQLITAPDEKHICDMMRETDLLIPTPGLPEHHSVMYEAAVVGKPVASEFDLARIWDSRPITAVTGTSGKTTVTEMVVAALRASGIVTMVAGNVDVPLVTAIERPDIEVFVVEASSFRLGHSQCFKPIVGCWLNFSPDHLDVHRSIRGYETAKAKIWKDIPVDGIAVANKDDLTVMRHLPTRREALTFSTSSSADWEIQDGKLVGPFGVVCSIDDLRRRYQHDLANTLAASAIATAVGGKTKKIREALCEYEPGRHRLELVGVIKGVEYYNDSKATTPHATLAAMQGFDSLVLIAGGRNKKLDLKVLAGQAESIHSVIALGEASEEIVDVFRGLRPVIKATDMHEAVHLAEDMAEPPMTVLLSPACASFDSYNSYVERGEDFTQVVIKLSNQVR